MSYLSIRGVSNGGKLIDYLFQGLGSKRKYYIENGLSRATYATCSAPNLAQFSKEINLAQSSGKYGRLYGALSLVQSFPQTDLKVDRPEDIEFAHYMGIELANRLYFDSDFLLVTHIDGKGIGNRGAMVHNHLVVVNNDLKTGKAIAAGSRLLNHIRRVNDDLSRESGLSVINTDKPWRLSEATERNLAVHSERQDTRPDQASIDWCKKHDFDTILQRKIVAVQSLNPRNFEQAHDELMQLGVSMDWHKHPKNGHPDDYFYSVTYGMVEPHYKHKKGGKTIFSSEIEGRKSTALGAQFKGTAWQAIFQAQMQQQKQFNTIDKETKKHRKTQLQQLPMVFPDLTEESDLNSLTRGLTPEEMLQPTQKEINDILKPLHQQKSSTSSISGSGEQQKQYPMKPIWPDNPHEKQKHEDDYQPGM